MKKLLLCVILAAVFVMSGCSGQETSSVPDSSVSDKSAQLGETLSETVRQSKVTSANASAQAVLNAAKVWLAECEINGAVFPAEDAVIRIESRGGTVIVSAESFDSLTKLADLLREDFGGLEFNAAVYYSKEKAVGCVYSAEADAAYIENRITAENFSGGKYNWGSGKDGVTEDGYILGTFPILFLN